MLRNQDSLNVLLVWSEQKTNVQTTKSLIEKFIIPIHKNKIKRDTQGSIPPAPQLSKIKGTTSRKKKKLPALISDCKNKFVFPHSSPRYAPITDVPSDRAHWIWHYHMVRYKTTKTNHSLNKKNKKKEKKTFKVQKKFVHKSTK